MWQNFTNLVASVIQLTGALARDRKDIEELQEQAADLQVSLKLLAQKLEHFTEMERSNRERFAEAERANHRQNLLELENRLLQMERRLPPADPKAL